MERFLSEARHSVRSLRRTPLLTLGAAAALAIGIGATTTLFSVVRGGTRNLPFDDPERIVIL